MLSKTQSSLNRRQDAYLLFHLLAKLETSVLYTITKRSLKSHIPPPILTLHFHHLYERRIHPSTAAAQTPSL